MTESKWIRVTRREPCVICERPDWCTRTADGNIACCMRVESPKRAKNGGWIHRLSDPLPEMMYAPEPKKQSDWTHECKSMYSHWRAAKSRSSEARRLGVTVRSLELLRVGAGFDHDGTRFTSWPMRDAKNKCVGYVRRYYDGKKKTNKGGSLGLFYASGWWQGEYLLIVEGGSDVAACLSCGMMAVGRPSNSGGLRILGELLKGYGKPVAVIGERDRNSERVGTVPSCTKDCPGCAHCWPGRYGMEVTAQRVKAMPVMLPEGTKDVREALPGMKGWIEEQVSRLNHRGVLGR